MGLPYFNFSGLCDFKKESVSKAKKIRFIASPPFGTFDDSLDHWRAGFCHWAFAVVGGIGGSLCLFDVLYYIPPSRYFRNEFAISSSKGGSLIRT